MNHQFQLYIICMEMLLTFYTRVEYISVKKYTIQTSGDKNPETAPFPGARARPSNTPSLIRHHSPPNDSSISSSMLHNNTTKCPLVTMGCPKFTPKTAPFL